LITLPAGVPSKLDTPTIDNIEVTKDNSGQPFFQNDVTGSYINDSKGHEGFDTDEDSKLDM